MEKNKKRIRMLEILGVLIGIALLGRLYYIQIVCHEEYAKAAQSQYEINLIGMDCRGQIYDRNGIPLTGGQQQYYYILPVKKINAEAVSLLKRIEADNITVNSSKYTVYRSEIFDEDVHIQLQKMYDAYVFSSKSRYSNKQIACHLIGYLNESEQRGVFGLEEYYEDVLKADNTILNIYADASGKIIPGISPQKTEKIKKMETNSLTVSIDKNLQKSCEGLLETYLKKKDGYTGKSGACIVSLLETGEILAMCSYPTFNPNQIASYLQEDYLEQDCLLNKAIQGQYPPGSIFKLVVAAAALEYGICDESRIFCCNKTVEINGVHLSCSTAPEKGHGELTMSEAMAKSCNCYFAQLGELVGREKILQMAETLGFGQTVLDGFSGEQKGNLPAKDEGGEYDITNLSIGQGEILATPMQVHQLMATIANRGMNLKFELEKSNGGSINMGEQLLLSTTASTLCNFMRAVTETGTASHIQWETDVCGKSGTAEAIAGGKLVKHCWFSGICSAEQTYVITVLVEDGTSGSQNALPIFHDITTAILQFE